MTMGPGQLKGAACHGKSSWMSHIRHLSLDPRASVPLSSPNYGLQDMSQTLELTPTTSTREDVQLKMCGCSHALLTSSG